MLEGLEVLGEITATVVARLNLRAKFEPEVLRIAHFHGFCALSMGSFNNYHYLPKSDADSAIWDIIAKPITLGFGPEKCRRLALIYVMREVTKIYLKSFEIPLVTEMCRIEACEDTIEPQE